MGNLSGQMHTPKRDYDFRYGRYASPRPCDAVHAGRAPFRKLPVQLSGEVRMRRHLASSRSPQSRGLRQVTLVVPESCVEGFRQFANELRARHQAGSTEVTPRWLALSPSAELMVSPERSARCAVRDTRAPGEDRFRWTVAILGQLDPIAQGRTGDRAEARMLV